MKSTDPHDIKYKTFIVEVPLCIWSLFHEVCTRAKVSPRHILQKAIAIGVDFALASTIKSAGLNALSGKKQPPAKGGRQLQRRIMEEGDFVRYCFLTRATLDQMATVRKKSTQEMKEIVESYGFKVAKSGKLTYETGEVGVRVSRVARR